MHLVIRLTDTSWSHLNENDIVINNNEKIIYVNVNIKDTRKDLKLKHSIAVLGGTGCCLC